MSTPALLRLREHFPLAHIALLCHKKLVELWIDHPAVDAVLSFEERESPRSIGSRLRREKFDLALLFPNSFRSALEAFMAGIPQRIGSRSGLRRWLLTTAVPFDPKVIRLKKRSKAEILRRISHPSPAEPSIPLSSHQLHHYLRLVAAVGASGLPLPPHLTVAASDRAEATAEGLRSTLGRRVVGLNAGAEYGPAKRWPVTRFAEAANRLHSRTGCHFLVFGGPADVSIAHQLRSQIYSAPVTVLAGKTTLRQLMARLECCDVLITNDTGPMHLAAALGVPVVVPFGSTSPELTGPGNPGDPRHTLIKSEAACAPCFRRQCPVDFRCMTQISIDLVVNATERCLGRLD